MSPEFQVVIPRPVRESLGIEPGQKLQVLIYRSCLEFIPLRPMRKVRGFLKGIDTSALRARDRV